MPAAGRVITGNQTSDRGEVQFMDPNKEKALQAALGQICLLYTSDAADE